MTIYHQNCSLAEIVRARSQRERVSERVTEKDGGGSNHGGGGKLEYDGSDWEYAFFPDWYFYCMQNKTKKPLKSPISNTYISY